MHSKSPMGPKVIMTLAKVKLDVGDEGEDSVMINVVIVYML